MTTEQFCYWLQGFFEVNGDAKITPQQAQIIKDHLATVFKKVTPDYAKHPVSPSVPEKQIDPYQYDEDDFNKPWKKRYPSPWVNPYKWPNDYDPYKPTLICSTDPNVTATATIDASNIYRSDDIKFC